jgi:hypothetical protein
MEAVQPHVFRYSLDWRFLLPIADAKKVCLLSEEDTDLTQTLDRVGINSAQRLSLSDLQQKKKIDVQSFVIPLGLPVGWVSATHEAQTKFYSLLGQLLNPEGHVLIGFNNVWNLGAQPPTSYRSSTPQQVTAQLEQAGFRSIKVFGAMPNLSIPEYIFDLEPRTIQFALENRFRRKPMLLRILRVLSGTLGWKGISNFLPCYFAVATN